MTKEIVTKEIVTKEIVKKENTEIIGADLFDLKTNLEGIEARLPQINIIHQAQIFTFPDETKKEVFSGVILDICRTNAYWAVPFDQSGGGDSPDCFSLDGINPDPLSESLQSDKGCAACEKNKFGSDGKRGKSCKNMKRIHVLIEDRLIPYRLSCPPSGLKAVDLYVSLQTSQGIPYQLINTEFSLKSVKNKEGIAYSELSMKNIGIADFIKTKEDAIKLKGLISQWREAMRGQPLVSDEMV